MSFVNKELVYGRPRFLGMGDIPNILLKLAPAEHLIFKNSNVTTFVMVQPDHYTVNRLTPANSIDRTLYRVYLINTLEPIDSLMTSLYNQ